MQSRFDSILSELDPGRKILLAVSGGIDSMVMASLFLNSGKDIPFAIAHCNFHLRGAESDSDEALVRNWAESHGIDFYTKDFATSEHASSRGVSIEMAARELRYAWFAQLCLTEGFPCVAVAHNANDNAETLILNLLRGTGLRGMTGMKRFSRISCGGSEVDIFRPLLDFSREEITEYALSSGLEWHEDSTNGDSAYKRNCVRNEIFPLFSRINPSFLRTLNDDSARFSLEQKAAEAYLDQETARVSMPCMEGESLRLSLDALRISKAPECLLFRLLEPFGFSPSVSESIVSSVMSCSLASGRTYLSEKFRLVTSGSEVIVTAVPAAASAQRLEIPADGEYSLAGISFSVGRIPWTPDLQVRQPEGSIILDSSRIDYPFVIRIWKPGDWMRPLGLKTASGSAGRKKLSDLFVDLKYSLMQKEHALVVEAPEDSSGRVAALLWKRVDESFKVNENTASVILVKRKP